MANRRRPTAGQGCYWHLAGEPTRNRRYPPIRFRKPRYSLADLHHLRQQAPKPDDLSPNLCLADYVAPAGMEDYVGGFAVTSGLNLESILEDFPNDDFNQIMIKALADRFAEAFAEYLHERVRQRLLGVRCRRSDG